MIEKNLSAIQFVEGFKLFKIILTAGEENPDKAEDAIAQAVMDNMIDLAAIYLADDETLVKSRKDPEKLTPYILQAAGHSPKEVGEIVNFMVSSLTGSSDFTTKTESISTKTPKPKVKKN